MDGGLLQPGEPVSPKSPSGAWRRRSLPRRSHQAVRGEGGACLAEATKRYVAKAEPASPKPPSGTWRRRSLPRRSHQAVRGEGGSPLSDALGGLTLWLGIDELESGSP